MTLICKTTTYHFIKLTKPFSSTFCSCKLFEHLKTLHPFWICNRGLNKSIFESFWVQYRTPSIEEFFSMIKPKLESGLGYQILLEFGSSLLSCGGHLHLSIASAIFFTLLPGIEGRVDLEPASPTLIGKVISNE